MRKILLSLCLAIAACGAEPIPSAPIETSTNALQTAANVFNGSYHARLVWLAVPNSTVDGMLPSHLERRSQSLTASGTHPVALLHLHYASVNLPVLPPGTLPQQWNEWSYYIVDLKLKNGATDCVEGINGPFSYLPKSFADSATSVASGNALFGLHQSSATITDNAQDFDVASTDSSAPMTYDVDFGNLTALDSTGTTNMAALEALLNAGIIQRNALNLATYHRTDWKFGDSTTVIKSVDTTSISASSNELGSSFSYSPSGVNSSTLGTFDIAAPFSSYGPTVCLGL